MIYLPDALLTPHFRLSDLMVTETGLPNYPGGAETQNLVRLAQALEKLWETIGPLRIVSAYRTPEVNATVGGSPTSLHVTGEAGDFVPLTLSIQDYFARIYSSPLRDLFGEIILKPSQGTLHLSLPTPTKHATAMILDSWGRYRLMTLDELQTYVGEAAGEAVAALQRNPWVTAGAVLSLAAGATYLIYRVRS